MPSPPLEDRPVLVPAYTVCLYIIAGLALMTVFSHQMLLTMCREDDSNGVLTAIFRFLQAVEVIVFVAALAVAVLRSKCSPLATHTTAAVSILLAFWAPFGTAAFIWWVGWVRKRERVVV